MPNLKKFVALSLGAVCLLSSCNHTVNAEGAKKFIKENYTSTDKYDGIKSLQYSIKVTCTDDLKEYCVKYVKEQATDVGATSDEYKENSLSFTCLNVKNDSRTFADAEESSSIRLTEDQIDVFEETKKDGGKVIYTTSGKEISIYGTESENSEDKKNSYQNDLTDIYSDNGHLRYRRSYQKIKKGDSEYTFTEIYIITQATK